MRFHPNHTLKLIDESAFHTEIANVETVLSAYAQVGRFVGCDQATLHYEYFLAEDPRGSIVVVHGLSEFTKKFYEFAYYALNQGYNVFLYDQRCHGLSDRLTPREDVLHVDSFADYAVDLERFMEEVVLPADEVPVYLYSHSMGGAVCALYLADHPDKVAKAVFSAPLFEPVVAAVPAWLARLSVRVGTCLCGPKKRFFLSNDFDPDVRYIEAYGSSKARFDHNINLRKQDKRYQSSPMSFSWVWQSLTVRRTVLNPTFIGKIRTPILLISAENDRTVRNQPQREFAKNCPSCELVEISGATHALLAAKNEELEFLLKLIFSYLSA